MFTKCLYIIGRRYLEKKINNIILTYLRRLAIK